MKIKKLLAVAATLAAFTASSFAYDWADCWKYYGGGIKKGDMIVSAGIGLDYGTLSTMSYNGGYFIPAVSADFEMAVPVSSIQLPFTFGGYAAFNGYGWKDAGNYEQWTRLSFGGLAKYHVQLPVEKLDVYLGLKLGLSIWSEKWDSGYGSGTENYWHFDGNYVLGASYFFTDMFGANLELGYPCTRIALTVKF